MSSHKFFKFLFKAEKSKVFIDLFYYDEDKKSWIIVDFKTGEKHDYSHQLEEYKKAMESMGLPVKRTEILYLKVTD